MRKFVTIHLQKYIFEVPTPPRISVLQCIILPILMRQATIYGMRGAGTNTRQLTRSNKQTEEYTDKQTHYNILRQTLTR